MKRYIIDEENVQQLKNTRIVFTALSTSNLTLLRVYVYDNDISSDWYDITNSFMKNKKAVARALDIASDYLEEKLLQDDLRSDRGEFDEYKQY